MKIIIAGYGKMGHEIERTAIARGHEIVATFNTPDDWVSNVVPKADVVIEFSSPEAAPEIIRHCFDLGLPVVSGTTGWNEKVLEVKSEAVKRNKTFFYASNYSLGVNIFFQINRKLASFLCPLDEYSAAIHEIHHIHKKDAPSGTAITLANDIIENCDRYVGWNSGMNEQGKINITSERTGEVPGTHSIIWNSGNDTLEITHTAHSRQGFATGAVIAAEWLIGKSGVFGMEDLLFEGFKK